ncbi:MAG: winged helix-turn-helix domain-containing protein [Pseudomonadota bacterium]
MEPNITRISQMLAEPSRARMLLALMSGQAMTATELALEADITTQTASSHLGKLLDSELLCVRKQGRHKYFQINDIDVAELIENLLSVSYKRSNTHQSFGPNDIALRRARICYDHLAGEIGIEIFNGLINHQIIKKQANTIGITELGEVYLIELMGEKSFRTLTKKQRPFCKACLDWSERKDHLAGSLGAWVYQDLLSKKLIRKARDSRAITLMPKALAYIKKNYFLS